MTKMTPNTFANEPNADTLHEWDRTHQLHPWMAMDDWRGYDNMLMESADGIHLWDASGKRYIDGPGGMWCTQIGYGRQDMADAIAAQVMKLPYTSPFTNTTEPSAVLARKIAEMAPGDLNNVFFTTGGSTAVDTALRTMQYMNNRRGLPQKKKIIAREKGYHGSTYLAHSVTGKERDQSHFDFETRLVHFLPDVNPYRRPAGMSVEGWCDAKVADLEAAIAEIGADNIGAFIAEPILSSGGVIVPAPGYHKRTWELCRANDILYISDEVVTGFGRLGHWFASQEVFGIQPDMITCAKGLTSGYLPLGACIISDRVMEQMSDLGTPSSYTNGYTYSGHPVSCVAALKNIEIIEREGILEHVRAVTPHFQARLSDLMRFGIVGDARGEGLLGCIECQAEDLEAERKLGSMIDAACEEMGLIVRPLINMAVFSPPLIITLEQIDEMFDILERAIQQVEVQLAA
ncbi:aminotransferase [Leisingera sp. M523]|uniref:aminotransferase n=1 Tax=Leisingera sp. M523 TaxID=2867013 RepID=UPI0021A93295|nr:aminotransferase [Leisingera sp. M523]UWQ29111.1 aminotransferase [Leisingera sp. M523]